MPAMLDLVTQGYWSRWEIMYTVPVFAYSIKFASWTDHEVTVKPRNLVIDLV